MRLLYQRFIYTSISPVVHITLCIGLSWLKNVIAKNRLALYRWFISQRSAKVRCEMPIMKKVLPLELFNVLLAIVNVMKVILLRWFSAFVTPRMFCLLWPGKVVETTCLERMLFFHRRQRIVLLRVKFQQGLRVGFRRRERWCIAGFLLVISAEHVLCLAT